MHINLRNPKVTRPDVHLGASKKRKVATKTISYERYREILFQKVASGYLLDVAQDGSSKNAIQNYVFRNTVKNQTKNKKKNNKKKSDYIPP